MRLNPRKEIEYRVRMYWLSQKLQALTGWDETVEQRTTPLDSPAR